ncbi:MAG: hypothetical protein J5I90_17310 [Caldilineales bacterium]|nr:hypothetical protein [Caldilineales bacterium]
MERQIAYNPALMDAKPKPSPGRQIAKILAITFVSIVVSLFAIEICFRAAVPVHPAEAMGWFWKVPDPITGWSLIPGAEGRSYNEMYEYDVWVKVNDLGLRSPLDIGYEKPEGVYRILVLGDSFVEATQVELEETFGQQLGDILRERGLQVEVINAGTGGWGNDQELFWLREEGRKYDPDLVVLSIYPRNDFMNNYQPLESANNGANLKPYFTLVDGELVPQLYPFDPDQAPPVEHDEAVVVPEDPPPGPLTALGGLLKQHSYLYRWIDPRLRLANPPFAASLARLGLLEPGKETRLTAQGSNYVPMAYNIYRTNHDEEWQAAFEISEAIFAAIQAETGSMGADLVTVLANSPEEVYPDYWDFVEAQYPPMRGQDWSKAEAHDLLLPMLEKLGIPALDLRPAFRDASEQAGHMLHFKVDGHWTAEGHAVVGKALADYLDQLGVIPNSE